MERYKRKYEQWETAVYCYGKYFDVFINPATNELAKIESFKKNRELRGFIETPNSNVTYIFDSYLLHAEAQKELKLNKHKLINFIINIKKKRININGDGINGLKPIDAVNILRGNRYLNIRFSNFEVYYNGEALEIL